jgi:hypothetical protein
VETSVIPQVTVTNPGAAAESIPVTLEIGSEYSNTVTVALGPAEATTVSFPQWYAATLGSREVRALTSLPGDLNPANDSLNRMIDVLIGAW